MADVFHLPVNEEIVLLLLDSKNLTYEDWDAIYFSIGNSEMGFCHPILEKVSKKKTEALYKEE